MSKTLKDSLVVGFAVFAIFFGAGNLIFPPFIGYMSGSSWGVATIGLLLTGILLPVVSVIAVGNCGGTFQGLTRPISPWFYKVYMLFVMGLGAFISVPRTGGVAFETGLKGVFPNLPSYSVYIFLIIYFAINFYFANDKSNVIDKVGKILTPILLLILVFIVIMAFATPIGVPVDTGIKNPFTNAFTTAYQTGDILTGLLCAVIFIEAIKAKGYTDQKSISKITFNAVAIAFIGLLIVYGGLLYLGATGNSYFPKDVDQTALLVGLVRRLLGNSGVAALSIAVILACLTTSVGITATIADFISGLTKNKISFKMCVGIVSVIGVIMASGGVKAIINYAFPIFMLAYPVSIVITLLGLFKRFVPNDGAWKGAALMSVIVGVYDSFGALNIIGAIHVKTIALDNLVKFIPLSSQGFTWLVPSILGFIVGALIMKKSKTVEVAN
ncbi:branched-chain amino acid transport system II carrier protein [Clostridium sp. CF012]|uniref:branched-chain amino acid transport system II carrier protein n=1 Tax=Clostridium sp. CF012 TaxID=2843319 RepID=UPI001C0AF9AF|nr:branched-chain amino acid transport system II carrier protein [Clostridium sp. CF012]MBU3145136.1 branched-chain amino acid transport system II carrier protein [Clostridium sp. CF012]